jgi:DNA-nicking Smr family endonuclease
VGQAAPGDADDGGELFRQAVRDATPLADRHRVPVPGRAAAGGLRSRAAAQDASPPDHLAADQQGGRAFGVSRKTMRALASGRLPPQASLDLHRHTAASARDRLTRFLAESRAASLRTVLVITGKGLHSDPASAPPVARERLRDLVPGWLSGPLSSAVLAFTHARAEHGGEGALYVLLRSSTS